MENENEVVNEDLTNPQPSEGEPGTNPPAHPGDKTPPNELLNSLQTEREKRRLLEEKVKLLEQRESERLEEISLSDEGKIFKQEITSVKSEVSAIKEEAERNKVFETYPRLKEKEAEFKIYCEENEGMPLKTAAKAFLAENDMLEAPRQGLEKTTGGDKAPQIQGMTAQQAKELRENNYKEYTRLVAEDKLKII